MEENMNDMHGEETPRTDLTLFSEKMQELKSRIASVIVGQERTVDLVLTAILANGHVLIEGVLRSSQDFTCPPDSPFDRCRLQPCTVYTRPDAE